MSKKQRDKGKRYEQRVARWLRDCVGLPARREWQYRSGEERPDVDAGPFAVEAKHQKRPNIRRALMQAEKAARPGQWALAVCHFNDEKHSDAIVAMRARDFEDLVQEWYERGAKL